MQCKPWIRLPGDSASKRIGYGAAALLLTAVAYAVLGCPMRLLTGLPCPGCGMTRAWLSVLRLDFAAAFAFHPLWPLPLLLVVCWFTVRRRSAAAFRLCLGAAGLLLVIVFVIRLSRQDPIVALHPEDGLIIRALHICGLV